MRLVAIQRAVPVLATVLAAFAARHPGAQTIGEGRRFAVAAAVPAGRMELPVSGQIYRLGVSPDGRVWMGSDRGELFSADSVNGDWRAVLAPSRDAVERWDPSLGHLHRVTWVNERTAIVSGEIGGRGPGSKNRVLRTTDGGARWTPVRFGAAQWILDVFVDARGGVWMGGSAGALVFSRDGGATWVTRARPFGANGRLNTIWIDDGVTGVVGAMGNALKLTRDGGRSWRPLATPLDQGRLGQLGPGYRSHGIEAVALLRGALWVLQDGHLFTSPVQPVAWREAAPEPVHDFTVDRGTGTPYALAASGFVLEIGPGGEPRRVQGARLNAPGGHLVASRGVVYAIDGQGGLYRISPGRTVFSRPLTTAAAPATPWRVAPGADRTWGATVHGIYAAGADSAAGAAGRGWRLLGTTPFPILGMRPLDGGRVMVWDGQGFVATFDARTARLEPVRELSGYPVVEVVATDSLWVAHGGWRYEIPGRVEEARAFYPGEPQGSGPHGFVLVSRDRGASWTRVDEWERSGVSTAFVHPDGAITLLSFTGAVRRLTPEGGGYRAETLLASGRAGGGEVPWAEWVGALYFNGAEGWLDGWTHHVGNRRWVTHDGGRSWTFVEPRRNHYRALFPVRGGWVGNTGYRLFWIGGGTERVIYDSGHPEPPGDPEAHHPEIYDAAAGPDGTVTVLLRSGGLVRVRPPGP